MNLIKKWDIRFLRLAQLVSTWSKDPSTKCGAVITKNIRVVSLGFNGFPQFCEDNPIFYNDREEKLRRVQHAERNAILFAQKDLDKHSIFVYPMPPCSQCTGAIIQSGIERIVTIQPTPEQKERWRLNFETSQEMLMEAEVEIDYYKIEEIF